MKNISNKLKELMEEYKGEECTFLKMECAFSEETGHDPLDNLGVDELLEDGIISFDLGQIDNEANVDYILNVEFDVIEENKANPLETVIKITDIDIV
ncbi:hypothetical protein [Clostridium sp. HBUAS56017]|uniref:hypothetical protein n=1 Tax=Clostridium sp. HBUAS56017 TaxID=2571128 RepID=UPI00117753AA|nr:hypothetical protein [Clostridium sp. HBUAS56017]